MVENKAIILPEKKSQFAPITNRQSNHQIMKDVASNFISSLSGGMFSLAMGLMLLHDTHSPLSFGLETAIVPIVGLIFLIPVGNIVDQYHHKIILVVSLIARLVGLVIFALIYPLFTGIYKLVPVAGFVVINAISTNFNTTAYSASVHELVNDQKIQLLSSLTQAASALSSVLSPAIGVAVYALIGFETFIVVEIIATFAALMLLLSMQFHYSDAVSSVKNISKTLASQLSGFKTGLQYIRHRPLIRDLILVAIVVNFLFTAITIGLPFVITAQLHAGNMPIGYIEIGFSAGIFIGSIIMSIIPNNVYFSLKIVPPIIVMGACMALLGLLLATVTQPVQLTLAGAVIMFVAGSMSGVMNVSTNIRLQTTVPSHLLGRVNSTLMTSVTAIMPIGTLIYTFLFQSQLSGALVIAVSGVMMLGYVIGFLRLILKDIRGDKQFQGE
ncbi:MFS transporter [Lentilactobacillus hilgardii]|uniref:MFS transporter n=1 Tax=Lentilactobacillus hilgardii TaxID=1588 RepID=UPI00390C6F20